MSSVNFLAIILLLIASVCSPIVSYRPPEPMIVTDITSQGHQICSSIEPPGHGSVKITQDRFYEFFCEDDYMMQGEHIFSCVSYNRGEKTKPKCIIRNHYSDEFEDVQSEESLDSVPYIAINEPISHSITKYPNPPASAPPPPTYTKPSNDNPCLDLQCEQLCLMENGVYECKCCGGYKLNTDKRTCRVNKPDRINMNDCLRQHKKVGDLELRPCQEGYRFDYTTKGCIEKSPRLLSVSRPRPLPPTSSFESCSLNNGGCEHDCVAIDSRTVMCRCQNGYEHHSDGKHCIEKSPRLPLPPPTSSFESCSVNNGGCQHDCVMIDSRTVMCRCQNGYELYTDGKHCIDINECSINNFDCSHRCVNRQGTAFCTCPSGFTLDSDKKTCIDIDECSQDDKNRCQHYCQNTVGSYTCSCKPGYILIEGYNCEGCRKNSFWSYTRNACVDCPRNSHTDLEGKTSLHDCVCDSGYAGSPGDYSPCEDIDECRVNNFGCSYTCINIPGSSYCICPTGFMLDTDSKTCIDINECSIKNGGCEGLCRNTEGSFECICLKGFTASSKDRYSCDDIDECSKNNGGCEHSCINYRGGFYCACKPGYRLDNTLKNCTDIQCPKLPQPHYSNIECKYKNMILHEESSYPAGTKCTFTCGRGFKNVKNDNKMKCQKDGTWNGTLPECKPQSCPPLKVPENAKIHPDSCYKHGAKVKQKCSFSCHSGYVLDGLPVFTCKNNLTWSKGDVPVCKPVKIQPVVKCPEDIQVTLLQGKATQNITVPEPTTNGEYYEVHPSWVSVNKPVEFSVGVTQVTFTANSSFNEIAQCGMTVTILDEEPPVFHSCPDSITIEGANGSGEFVSWDKPVVTDNVELLSVFSILEPNVTLTPGTYLAEYVARDSSGNIAKCSFNISIVRANCSDLRDPARGKANCMDWMFGKLCSPECDDGYMRNPDEPLYYSCDDSGVWEPNELISECLQFTLATSSGCQDGFELKKVEADILEHEVCIACPSNAVWSPATRKCEK